MNVFADQKWPFFLIDQTFDQQNILTNKTLRYLITHVPEAILIFLKESWIINMYFSWLQIEEISASFKSLYSKPCTKNNNKQNTRVNFRDFSLTFRFSGVIKVLFVLIEKVLLNVGHFLTDFWQFWSWLFEIWIQLFLDFYGYK